MRISDWSSDVCSSDLRRKRNQGRLEKLVEMRATRAAMIGGPGVAKLGLANDDVRSKSVIVADHISKSFAGRPIIRDFTFRIQRGEIGRASCRERVCQYV